jgi:hypothetical protein
MNSTLFIVEEDVPQPPRFVALPNKEVDMDNTPATGQDKEKEKETQKDKSLVALFWTLIIILTVLLAKLLLEHGAEDEDDADWFVLASVALAVFLVAFDKKRGYLPFLLSWLVLWALTKSPITASVFLFSSLLRAVLETGAMWVGIL